MSIKNLKFNKAYFLQLVPSLCRKRQSDFNDEHQNKRVVAMIGPQDVERVSLPEDLNIEENFC
jgi:hypothetical protein